MTRKTSRVTEGPGGADQHFGQAPCSRTRRFLTCPRGYPVATAPARHPPLKWEARLFRPPGWAGPAPHFPPGRQGSCLTMGHGIGIIVTQLERAIEHRGHGAKRRERRTDGSEPRTADPGVPARDGTIPTAATKQRNPISAGPSYPTFHGSDPMPIARNEPNSHCRADREIDAPGGKRANKANSGPFPTIGG